MIENFWVTFTILNLNLCTHKGLPQMQEKNKSAKTDRHLEGS